MNPAQLTSFRDEYTKLAAKKMSMKKMKELLSMKLFGKAPKKKSIAKGALKGALEGAGYGATLGVKAGGPLGVIASAAKGENIFAGMGAGAFGGALAGGAGGAGLGTILGALSAKQSNKAALKKFMAAKGAKKEEMLRNALVVGGAGGTGAGLGALLANKKGKK